jgi:hypothetical protein
MSRKPSGFQGAGVERASTTDGHVEHGGKAAAQQVAAEHGDADDDQQDADGGALAPALDQEDDAQDDGRDPRQVDHPAQADAAEGDEDADGDEDRPDDGVALGFGHGGARAGGHLAVSRQGGHPRGPPTVS